MFKKFFLLAITFLFTSCHDPGERDNPDDPYGINYVAPPPPSSSSVAPSSSSSAVSSSSLMPSSSSVGVSSSSGGGVSGTSTFKDDRDNKIYKLVKIGTQTWMAENLNYNASGSKCGNGSSLSDGNTATCDKYGRLYSWATAMALDASCNSISCASQVIAKHRGICPSGWHIPSDAEWDALMTAVGGASTAGTKLKATNGWNSSGNGQDTYGFASLPGGNGVSDGGFYGVGYYGNWWSATEHDAYGAYGRYMSYINEYVYRYSYDKSDGLVSVRCLQD